MLCFHTCLNYLLQCITIRKQIPKRGHIKADKFKFELKHCFVNSTRTAKTTKEGAGISTSSSLHTKATYLLEATL